MVKVLLLSSDFTGEIKEVKIKDGSVTIDEKEFIIDKARPFQIKFRKLGKHDVTYICKWNSEVPIQFKPMEVESNGVKTMTLEPLDMKEYKSQSSPDLIAQTADMRFLKNLKKYSEEKKGFEMGGMIKIVAIALFGVAAVFLLFPMLGIKLF
jgi:hypothetical protein